jgi:hypothetical protein
MTKNPKKKALSSSRLVRCTVCYAKMCKIVRLEERKYLQVKHKKAMVIAEDAVIKCIGCGRHYYVTTDGLEKEVNLGRN